MHLQRTPLLRPILRLPALQAQRVMCIAETLKPVLTPLAFWVAMLATLPSPAWSRKRMPALTLQAWQ